MRTHWYDREQDPTLHQADVANAALEELQEARDATRRAAGTAFNILSAVYIDIECLNLDACKTLQAHQISETLSSLLTRIKDASALLEDIS